MHVQEYMQMQLRGIVVDRGARPLAVLRTQMSVCPLTRRSCASRYCLRSIPPP